MDNVVLAQDTAGAQYEEFWTDERFPSYDAERQLIDAVQSGDLALATMIVESQDVDINAFVPLNSAERPVWSRRRHKIMYELPHLVAAAKRDDLPMCEFLIMHGCDVNRSDNDQITPLMFASAKGYDTIVKLLAEQRDINMDLQDHLGRTALYHAADHGEDEIVSILIVNDADCNIVGPNGRTVLTTAAARGHLQIIKFLVSQEVPVDVYDDRGMSPLHHAIFGGHMAVVAYLVNQEGIDIHIGDAQGRTPFFLACRGGHISMARMLMEKGVKVTGHDVSYSGFRPIDAAREHVVKGKPSEYDEIVQMITDKISSDKKVDARDKNKMKILAEF